MSKPNLLYHLFFCWRLVTRLVKNRFFFCEPVCFFRQDASSSVLTLYATGHTRGTVVEVGEGLQQTACYYEGFCIENSANQQHLAGQDVTTHLLNALRSQGLEFSQDNLSDHMVVQKIKEDICSEVSTRIGYEQSEDAYLDRRVKNRASSVDNSSNLKDYILPDGRKIKLDLNETLGCQEVLFQPELARSKQGLIPLHEMVYNSIMKTDIDSRNDGLYQSVFLAGGGTMPKGFDQRLTNELAALAPASIKMRAKAPPERKYSVWIGGSILASLNSFMQMWISKEHYDEVGPSFVNRMCQHLSTTSSF